MDYITIVFLVLLSSIVLVAFCFREELGIIALLIFYCKFAPIYNLVVSCSHYLVDRLLDFFILFILIVIVLAKNSIDRRFSIIKTPLNLPMILFLGSILFSFILSVSFFSASPGLAFMGLMDVGQYTAFFLIIYSIKNQKQFNLFIKIILAISTLYVVSNIISFFKPDFPLRILGIVEQDDYGVYRLVPEALVLLSVIFLVTSTIFAFQKLGFMKILLLFEILTLLFVILLTFTRSAWFPLAFTCAGLGLLLSHKKILSYYSAIIVIIVSFIIMGTILPNFVRRSFGSGFKYTVENRISTLPDCFRFSGGLPVEPSLNERFLEMQKAMSVIKDNLITGVGYKYRLDVPWGTVSYLHNGYLSILMVQGLIGFIPFMWLIITFFFRSLKIYHDLDESSPYKGMILGLIGGFWFILMFSFLGNSFQCSQVGVLVLMLIMGICELVHKFNQEEQSGNAEIRNILIQ